MSHYPNLSQVDVSGLVQSKGTGRFSARYVPWSETMRLLREHAPDWQPYAAPTIDGSLCHSAPDGTCYLLIGFRHPDPEMLDTELVPHAVMDDRMRAKKNPDARDVSDSFVRGVCKAAALLFGLGWSLWTKDDPMARETHEDAPQRTISAPAYQGPDEAKGALEAAQTLSELTMIGKRIAASGFSKGDLEELRNTAMTRKERIKESEDA